MRIIIPLETYEALCRRLTQHHKGHKGLSDLLAVRSGLERKARIALDGVEVDLNRLIIAADAIRDNIKYVGDRYGSAPDKTVLLDIEEALAEYEAKSVSSVSEVEPPPAKAEAAVGPVQSLQRDGAIKASNETDTLRGPTQPLACKPYSGTDSQVARRINAGLEHFPVPCGSMVNIPNVDRRDLPEPPAGHVWWSDGAGGFDAMQIMAALPEVE